jgi:hypothetical protein
MRLGYLGKRIASGGAANVNFAKDIFAAQAIIDLYWH